MSELVMLEITVVKVAVVHEVQEIGLPELNPIQLMDLLDSM